MTNEPTLAACPFCGGEADFNNRYKYIACNKCSCGTPLFDTSEEAIASWNARHQPLEPMYYPSEQMQMANEISDKYIKMMQKYEKLLSYVKILSEREDYEYPFSNEMDDTLLPTQVLQEIVEVE